MMLVHCATLHMAVVASGSGQSLAVAKNALLPANPITKNKLSEEKDVPEILS
jgi:hypothetical protein